MAPKLAARSPILLETIGKFVCSMSITLQVIFLLAIDVMVEGYTTSTSFCRHLGHICMLWSFLVFSFFFCFSHDFNLINVLAFLFVVRVSVLFYTSSLFFYNSFILQVD